MADSKINVHPPKGIAWIRKVVYFHPLFVPYIVKVVMLKKSLLRPGNLLISFTSNQGGAKTGS
jgi:hypothetical protein